MAYSYVWPPTLPQGPQKGFTESIQSNIARVGMDSGIAKLRRRSAKPSTMSLTFLMTSAQVDVLDDFVTNTIKGTKRFGFTHPRTGNIEEVRFITSGEGELYNLQYAAPGFYYVKLQLEILP